MNCDMHIQDKADALLSHLVEGYFRCRLLAQLGGSCPPGGSSDQLCNTAAIKLLPIAAVLVTTGAQHVKRHTCNDNSGDILHAGRRLDCMDSWKIDRQRLCQDGMVGTLA